MSEIAVFRHINKGKPSSYITIAKKYIPPHWTHVTITIVKPDTWKTGKPQHGHLAKQLGATIHNSYKIVINKPLLEQLNLLEYKKPVWIRITEQTHNPPPPPPKPYIQRPATIHSDGSSYFFTLSANTINQLREITPGKNLKITVHLDKPITYVKRPIKIEAKKPSEQLYKILLPATLFEGKVKSGTTLLIRAETTDEPET